MFDNLYWYIRYGWKDIPYQFRMWRQRRVYGWAECDAWNMSLALDKTIVAMLDYNEGSYYGYPAGFDSFEEWMEIVNYVHVALKRVVWLESTERYKYTGYRFDHISLDEEISMWKDAQTAHELLGKYWYGFGT